MNMNLVTEYNRAIVNKDRALARVILKKIHKQWKLHEIFDAVEKDLNQRSMF